MQTPDLDDDRINDVVYLKPGTGTAIVFSNGGRTFQPPVSFPTRDRPRAIVSADVTLVVSNLGCTCDPA
ncbi:MAG: VCBS repeat-containing protein [Planctomycetota bacterium]